MDTDKFKNDLMIGETSSIEFKRCEMACLVVKYPGRCGMTLEEPKKQIADDECEMMEVKHA